MALVLKSNKSYNGVPSLLPQYNIINGAKKIYATYLANPLYKGFIAEIVNSSGEIKEIKAGDDGFLSATELASFAKGGNVTIKTLFNQSGGSGSAARSDVNYQPLIVENGVVVRNRFGKPSMRCVNARGLIDRSVFNLVTGDSLQYFIDAEPTPNPVDRLVVQFPANFQGVTSIFTTNYGVQFDTYSRIYTRSYNGDVSSNKFFGKQEDGNLVGLFEYAYTDGYVSADLNGTYIKESDTVIKPIDIAHITIASAGSSFNDAAKSFEGVFNCLIIR